MLNPASSAAVDNQRAVFHENGHTGSSHNVSVSEAVTGGCRSVINAPHHREKYCQTTRFPAINYLKGRSSVIPPTV